MTSVLTHSTSIPLHLVGNQCASETADIPVRTVTRQMKEGSDEGWREFHRRYYLALLRYAASVTGKTDEAADVVQQVYLRIGRHIKEFQDEEAFWRWLACVVRCAAVDHRRGVHRRAVLLERFAHWTEAQQQAPSPYAESGSRASLGLEALEQLPLEEARLIRWKYYEGWTVEEIARETGVTEKTIENRIARLRERLREIIATIK
jgi:RNA polymerase sigma-70 factor (ECF subfamily)